MDNLCFLTSEEDHFTFGRGFSIAADTLPQIEDLDNAVVEPELLVSNVEANSLTLEWPKYTDPSIPENPMSYIVELTQASNTATGRQHVETAATGTTFFSLLSGQAYEFEIIAKVLSGNTCVVGHGETETNNHAPSAPTILTPIDNAEEQPLSLLLDWSASTDPDGDNLHYGVYVGTHPSDLVRKTSEHGIEETQYTVTVEEGKTYHWQVVVKDGKGGINTSEKYSFSTISPLPKPHNPNPVDHSFDINPNQPLTLTWECAPNLVYDVYVGKNTPHLELEAANLTQTQYVLGSGSLDEQKRYYWQVIMKDAVSAVPAFDGRLTHLVQSITQRDEETDGAVWDFKTGKGDTVSYSISVQSSPTSGGDVRVNSGTWGDTKSATVTAGASATVEASAVAGYVFEGWYEGSTKISQNTLLSVNAWFNVTYTAIFVIVVPAEPIQFADPILEQAVRNAAGYTGQAVGPIYSADVLGITILDVSIPEGGQDVRKRIIYMDTAPRENGGLKSLEGIQYLDNLEQLYFYNNQVTDITPLRNLTKLVWLYFYHNPIVDIFPLQNLTNLEGLWFSCEQVTGITDITPLQNLTNLVLLVFRGNQVTDITPLHHLSNLEYLWFDGNQVSNITPLQNLTNLTELWFGKNQVSNLTPLQNLTNLTVLQFGSSNVSDLTPLQNLTKLLWLYFDNNQVSDITPLQNLTNLTRLYFDKNQVSDLTSLQNLPNLASLNFFGNQVSSITPIVNNAGLGTGDEIEMRANNLNLTPGSQNMQDINTLISRGCTVSYDPQN